MPMSIFIPPAQCRRLLLRPHGQPDLAGRFAHLTPVLLAKLFFVPLMIAAIALLGRRFGSRAAGLMSGFPIIGGPIVYFVYWDRGDLCPSGGPGYGSGGSGLIVV